MILVTAASGRDEALERFSAGDALSDVLHRHGSPVLEYPLDGTLVQEYPECTIISSNGIVLSADYKPLEPADEAPAAESAAPTMPDIKKNALAGDAEAQYLLAFCFQFGNHVEQDYSAAIGWYTKSAFQGYMPSQHNLGYLYMNGRGVEKDLKQAYSWGLLAAENGNDTIVRALKYKLSDEEKQLAEIGAEHLRLQMHAQKAAP